jgi:multidrug efflux system outer membrane protein
MTPEEGSQIMWLKRKSLISLLAFGGFALTGCSVGPKYARPNVAVDPSFHNATPTTYGPNEPIAQFWTQFQDPMLDRLVAEGMTSNYDLKIAMARLREARALRRETKFDQFPTVTAEADFTKSKLSTDQGQGFPSNLLQNELYEANFDAFWEIDFFGRVRKTVDAATAAVQATADDVRSAQVSVASEIARNYMELRGLQSQLAVAQRNADNQASTLEVTEARLEAGRGTEFDTERARAQLNSTRAIIPAIRTQIAFAEDRLAVLVGKAPSALVDELNKPGDLPRLPERIDVGSPEELLRRRPDIAAAERRVAQQTALVGVAVADLFPRVVFSGSVGLNAREFSNLGGQGSSEYSFGPSVTWPAFNLGRVRARIRASEARNDQVLAQYQNTVLQAIEETENALVALDESRSRNDELTKAAQSSKNAAELARIRFEGGIADFLQVLDAERTELDAEDRLAQSRTDTATATIAVYNALGVGFATTPGAPPNPTIRK